MVLVNIKKNNIINSFENFLKNHYNKYNKFNSNHDSNDIISF
jgi:hypothetical protein